MSRTFYRNMSFALAIGVAILLYSIQVSDREGGDTSLLWPTVGMVAFCAVISFVMWRRRSS